MFFVRGSRKTETPHLEKLTDLKEEEIGMISVIDGLYLMHCRDGISRLARDTTGG